MAKDKSSEATNGLNPKQIQFCKNFVSSDFFGNGVESYLNAYDTNKDKPIQYNTAKVNASKLLTSTNILVYINTLLDEAGLNDVFVDKQLLLLITQNADFSSKVSAIKEYNKLKTRITDKVDLTSTIIKVVRE